MKKKENKPNLTLNLEVNISEELKKNETNAGQKITVDITCIGKNEARVDISNA